MILDPGENPFGPKRSDVSAGDLPCPAGRMPFAIARVVVSGQILEQTEAVVLPPDFMVWDVGKIVTAKIAVPPAIFAEARQ